MSATRATGRSATIKRRALGLGFLAVIAGLVALTIAFYTKAFTPVVEVTVEASTAGNQLSAPADVKLRGLIVGEVRDISSTGGGAVLTLALDPDEVDEIPANVGARLIPKTLFGEKYVDLVMPQDASSERIAEGDVITQDRSETARETEQVLNDLLPLLTALQPQDLSTALNSVSGALRGRGDRIGQNLVLVDDYLKGFNPEIPALGENLGGVADFSDTLVRTTPDLSALLDNSSFIARSLVEQQGALGTFLMSTTTSTRELEEFLTRNENRLVRLAADSLPSLQTYAKYSPVFPCLAEGLVASEEILRDTFGGLQPGLHITLEFVEPPEGYTAQQDEPAYRDDRGPRCYGLPDPEGRAADINFQDGYRDDLGPDTTSEPATSSSVAAQDQATMSAVLGPVLGVPRTDVPDLAYLLFGPMARGTEVGLR